MKKSLLNQVAAARRWQTGAVRAFTLTELLVVLAIVAVLAAVVLSASFTTQERALRAECVSNLRQIATGWNMYQRDYNEMLPCHWPGYASSGGTSNPWRTYEAGRVVPGQQGWANLGTVDQQGPWNLGLLHDTKFVANAKLFYCPAAEGLGFPTRTYEYYSTQGPWPDNTLASGDDKIRTGYNYFPQGRKQVQLGDSGGHLGPAAASGICPGDNCTPLRQNDIDPNKSIATDIVQDIEDCSHWASGSVAGLNALFPDGRVVFQNARSNPQAFDAPLWKSTTDTTYIGNNSGNFRYVMSLWKP
jgi:prepilin-type N-terminal cleavage/methylation domain-containing protein